MTIFRTVMVAATMAIAMLSCSCSLQPASALQSTYPVAIDPGKVGDYPALAKSGAGYVYDEVLEYRVWINADGDDYYHAFATFEDADDYSDKTEGAEEPIVLVLQHEHINEPEPGKYEHSQVIALPSGGLSGWKETKEGQTRSQTSFVKRRRNLLYNLPGATV